MISASDRENAVLLINEAIASGASCKKACYRLGITERTFYRWKKRKSDINSYEDGRCIFRKNRALAPHERSAVPLGTDHCPVG